MSIDELARQLGEDPRLGPGVRLRQVTVTGAVLGRYTIRMAGSTVDIPNVRSACPLIAGDIAMALQTGPDIFIVSPLDTGWQFPIFQNSWVAYDTAGSYAAPKYRKANGIVYLTGLAAGSPSPTSAIFTLPVGFRPDAGANSGTILRAIVSNNGFTRLDITPGGVVSQAGATSAFVQLDCCFPAGG